MAHSKSARKRVRQNLVRRLRNRSAKAALRTAIKKFSAAAGIGDAAAASAAFLLVQKKVDKVAAKSILRKGTADRIKARLAARLHAIRAEKK